MQKSPEQNTTVLSRKISFYDEYSCMMGDCPSTCCRGWLVPVDDDTLKKYNSLKGTDYVKYMLTIKNVNGMKCFNADLKECAFHDKDGLCSLQKKYGFDYLSETCRIFPRTVYTHFTEGLPVQDACSVPTASEFLELSCPAAASLFIKHINDMDILTEPFHGHANSRDTNDDPGFYRVVLHANDVLCSVIRNSGYSLNKIYGIALNAGDRLQKIYLNNDPVSSYALSMEFMESSVLSEVGDFYISARLIDHFMTGGYYHPRVKRESELLYRLCRLYFEVFDKKNISEIDEIYSKLPEGIKTSEDLDFSVDRFLRCHFFYILSATFTEVFEDYSFSLRIAMAIARNQLLSIFLWLYSNKKEPLNHDNLYRILYSFHRRGAGGDGLYYDFSNELLKSRFEKNSKGSSEFSPKKTDA